MKQGPTKGEYKFQQNDEAIININNNKNIYKKNNYRNSAHTRESGSPLDDFSGVINNFTANEEVRAAIGEYIKMRLKRPKTVTTGYAVTLALKRLGELSLEPETQIKILNQSILNSYPDLYELKKAGETNDYHGKSTGSGRADKARAAGLATGKAHKYAELFPGVVRLGAPD